MKQFQRLIFSALVATTGALALSACAPLVVGGAAMSAFMVMDRRTSGAQVEDEGIEFRAGSRIRDALGERVNVYVTSYNRQVLLTGEVPDAAHKQTVEDIVSKVENVRGVVNELAIAPHTSLSERSSDTLITGRVKASLVDARDLSASAFKVTTERGVVYLLGIVTQREADRAAQVARNVDGVRKVVRVFEIVSEADLARLPTSPVPATPARVSATPARVSAPASPVPAPAAVAPPAPAAAPGAVATPVR